MLYKDPTGDNGILCDYCITASGGHTEDYEVEDDDTLHDCGIDVGYGGDGIPCACWSCEEMENQARADAWDDADEPYHPGLA